MAKIVEFVAGEANVSIVLDDDLTQTGASQKAGTAVVSGLEKIKAHINLAEAASVVGQLADSFSATLRSAASKPSSVDITFGLEASGELGNFLISKVSGKTNFSVKLTWKFD